MPHLSDWKLFFAVLVTCAATGLVPASAEDSRATIRLDVGGTQVIALKENPSTGYRWQIDVNTSRNLSLVEISDAGFAAGASDSRMVGVPGQRRFSITARQTGTALAVFNYARPWEHITPIRRHSVTIGDRKSTRLNSSHIQKSRMPSSA